MERKTQLEMLWGPTIQEVSQHQKKAEMSHAASIALMKWLSKLTQRLGVAKHIYVVGGAVRNFLIDQPIKDIDMVVDSISLGRGRDAEWVAKQIARQIPVRTEIVTDNLRVSKVQIRAPWTLEGHEMEGNDIEIVDARLEEYDTNEQGDYLGHKPLRVEPTTLETDVTRREFTFNTLMWRLHDLASGPEKAEIIDLTGCGVRDLENREMRCPGDPDNIFAQDPTRIIRTVKFAFKYGFKLPPDVKAAAKRQAKGLKRIPAKAWGALEQIIFGNPQYKKALDVMADLGVIDVLRDMMQENRQFRTTIQNYAEKRGVQYLFDLMDMGLPLGAPIKFLTSDEQRQVRKITVGMDRDEAWDFVTKLKKPGDATKDPDLFPEMMAQLGLEKRDARLLNDRLVSIIRGLLLNDPKLAQNPSEVRDLVRREINRSGL